MGKHLFRLSHDLLWHIIPFIVNLDYVQNTELLGADFSLITLRHISQVCSSWRVLVLSTTTWWARAINLNHLDQKFDRWRDEVLRRSGQSALCITGYLHYPRCNTRFLEVLLKKHWARLQVLHLVSDVGVSYYLDFDIFQYLQLPAPLMEVFVIRSPPDHHHRFPSPNFRYFSNSAPALRCFRALPTELGAFMEAPFIPQLRKLDLSNSRIDPQQLLDALGRMKSLQELINVCLTRISVRGSTSSIKVSLPHLRCISLSASDVNGWLKVLSEITPDPQCTLHTLLPGHEHHTRLMLTAADIPAISQTLSFYSERYTSSQSPTRLLLRFRIVRFAFRHEVDLFPWWQIAPNLFSFFLNPWHTLPPNATSTLVKSLATRDFTTVVSLDLEIEEHCGLDPTDSNFIELISSLYSVKALTTDLSTLRFLLRLPLAVHSGIFPFLTELRYPYSTEKSLPEDLTKFISWRDKVGYPIQVLDITPEIECTERRDFRFLDRITGLKVVWDDGFLNGQMGYHVCGSSNPDVLDFPEVEYSSEGELE